MHARTHIHTHTHTARAPLRSQKLKTCLSTTRNQRTRIRHRQQWSPLHHPSHAPALTATHAPVGELELPACACTHATYAKHALHARGMTRPQPISAVYTPYPQQIAHLRCDEVRLAQVGVVTLLLGLLSEHAEPRQHLFPTHHHTATHHASRITHTETQTQTQTQARKHAKK